MIEHYQAEAVKELYKYRYTQKLVHLSETRVFSKQEVELILRQLPTAYTLKTDFEEEEEGAI